MLTARADPGSSPGVEFRAPKLRRRMINKWFTTQNGAEVP